MHLQGAIVSLLSLFLILSPLADAWGSAPVNPSNRPDRTFEANFPSTPTFTVPARGSVASILAKCNGVVGPTGYCWIRLTGNPKDKSIKLTRSRTKLTSNGAEIRSKGPITFVSIGSGVREIVVADLNIRGHTSREVFGVYVRGSNIKHVVIRNNNVYKFNGKESAHGIAVIGTGAESISDVVVDRNEVYNMKTGFSESIVVNGNVERWEIINNYVHDVNNIAIDAIGGEGEYKPLKNASGPREDDIARKGFIENNTVERMSTKSNPKYRRKRTWAAGIYVDGAKDIVIEGNTILKCPWGIEIGAENCVVTKNILARFNSVSGSYFGDLLVGGYAARGFLDDKMGKIQCNPLKSKDRDEGHGNVEMITIEDNDLLSKSSKVKEEVVFLEKRIRYAIIKQAGVTPVDANGDGSATGDENAIRTS